MKKFIDNKKGFSLVEIIVSVVILALLSMGIMTGISFSQKMSKSNMEKEAKMTLVQEVVDDIAALINTDPHSLSVLLELEDEENIWPVETEYSGIEISISPQFFSDNENNHYSNVELWKIEATLEYETGKGTESVSLTRLALPGAE